ncbi:MAG TPA: asparaginase [Azospirillaceae bacterium]|nr:asparaginase [Azospirillaceae bacterium]
MPRSTTHHTHHAGCGCHAAPAAAHAVADARTGAPAGGAAVSSNPVAVEVTRGGIVESRHRARACLVDADGNVVRAWGDVDEPVFPRSAVKAVQALPLVETGALDATGGGERELALACASHNAEPVHTELAAAWLARMGQTEAAYECGAHLPMDEATAHDLIRRGEAPTSLHNNCSGKHAGMIATAVHLGEPVKGYTRLDHPVQQRIQAALSELAGVDAGRGPIGIDGCSVPNWGLPLAAFGRVMARFADPSGLPAKRAEAMRRIVKAWTAHPHLVAGRNRFDTRLMELLGTEAASKGGAEGVHAFVIPGRRLALVVKADDGAGRAADVAAAALLRGLGVGTDAQWGSEAGQALLRPVLRNRAGTAVGELRAAEGWA